MTNAEVAAARGARLLRAARSSSWRARVDRSGVDEDGGHRRDLPEGAFRGVGISLHCARTAAKEWPEDVLDLPSHVAGVEVVDPPVATTQSDYDSADSKGRWRAYLHEFFDRHIAGVGCTTADFTRINVPALMLAGDRDMFCPVEVASPAYRALPAGALGIVPKTGHEITPALIEAMTAFLMSVN